MNLAELGKAILDRIQADTAVGGLYESSAWTLINGAAYHRMAEGTDRPYVAFNIPVTTEFDAYEEDIALASVFFRVVTPMATKGDGADPLDTASDIIDRIIGDATRQSDGIPTYGFHRYKLPDAVTDVYTHMTLVSQTEAHDSEAGEYVFVLEFEVHVTTT